MKQGIVDRVFVECVMSIKTDFDVIEAVCELREDEVLGIIQ